MPRYGARVTVTHGEVSTAARFIAGVQPRKAMVELDGTHAMVTVPSDWITLMDNVRVYHAVEPFRDFDEERTGLEQVYSYAATSLVLEEIWRWNNTVDGDAREENTRHYKRSLSVGDVVGIADFDGNWTYHAVEAMGWREVSSEVVDRALERGAAFDPFVGL